MLPADCLVPVRSNRAVSARCGHVQCECGGEAHIAYRQGMPLRRCLVRPVIVTGQSSLSVHRTHQIERQNTRNGCCQRRRTAKTLVTVSEATRPAPRSNAACSELSEGAAFCRLPPTGPISDVGAEFQGSLGLRRWHTLSLAAPIGSTDLPEIGRFQPQPQPIRARAPGPPDTAGNRYLCRKIPDTQSNR